MADVCEARRGRGAGNAGNGGNAKWFNSPLWDSIDAKKGKTNTETKEQSAIINQEINLDDLDLKAKQRKMYALAY